MKVNTIIDEINDASLQIMLGETDALQTFIELKKIEKALKTTMEAVYPDAQKEADKYGGKTFDAFGASITKSEGKRMYSYAHIPTWDKLNKDKTRIEEIAKALASKGVSGVDESTGEVIQPAMVTYQKPSLTITIKS